jgi:hypothetical protein
MMLETESEAAFLLIGVSGSGKAGPDAVAGGASSLIEPKKEERMQAYCLKCRTQREMSDPQQIQMKNGKPATQGKCPVCGTKMYRIGSSK